ncbi:MAG: hypothetical protein JNK79_10245 [Chitinophagaceae bacterium]|nr:hypothetical protein [Chitinophagaceae bacterium]
MKEIVADVEKQSEFIENVAAHLMRIFLRPLQELDTERTYFTHVGILAEILEWALEFSNWYYFKLNNWSKFKSSRENIFNSENLEEFVTAYGHMKFMRFCLEHSGYQGYFFKKYHTEYN